MKLIINEQVYVIKKTDENRKLLWFLRDSLGLIGTRFGCGAGLCGACTVLIDGQPTRSCITSLGPKIDGKRVQTVEGLAKNGTLHPVQQAFIDEQVPQCGWCMSGQMMTAVALLNRSLHLTERQIDDAMKQNYCRCGCYVRIRRAVQKVSTLFSQSKI